MSHRYQQPLWVSMAQRLVNIAKRELARKARRAAAIKALYTIENRAKFVEGGKAGV